MNYEYKFKFAIGHRVDMPGHECRTLHGHGMELTFWAPSCDVSGFKSHIETFFDRNMIICEDDSHLRNFLEYEEKNIKTKRPVMLKIPPEIEDIFNELIARFEVNTGVVPTYAMLKVDGEVCLRKTPDT